MTGLSMLVQQTLSTNPFDGAVFAFRGRRAGLIKLLWHDGVGLCMLTKKLDRGRFVWPQAKEGVVSMTMAQMSMLLESIDWRATAWTVRPELVV